MGEWILLSRGQAQTADDSMMTWPNCSLKGTVSHRRRLDWWWPVEELGVKEGQQALRWQGYVDVVKLRSYQNDPLAKVDAKRKEFQRRLKNPWKMITRGVKKDLEEQD